MNNLPPAFHNLFAALVEVVALDKAQDEQWMEGYYHILTHIVEENGGSMDDEAFVDAVDDQFIAVIEKNAAARREVLLAQAA